MGMRRKYRRTKVGAAESAELWERWRKGEGLHAIGAATGAACSGRRGQGEPIREAATGGTQLSADFPKTAVIRRFC